MSISKFAPARARRLLRAAGQDLPNLITLLIFFGATALLFRSWEFALVVTASLGFHEVGHACALIWHRQEWRIHFGVVGAWTWSSAEQRARLSQLANASIHLAGPFFSLALAMAALALYEFWLPGDRRLLILANFSAQVGFLNLLPLGAVTDGGKVVQRMMASLEPRRRRRAIWLPTLLTLVIFSLYGLVEYQRMTPPFLAGLLLIGLWLTGSMSLEALASIHAQAGRTIPVTGRLEQPRPMSVPQVSFLTALVWDMLALYLIIISSTPFWLEPAYVRGSLLNVLTVLNWIFRVG